MLAVAICCSGRTSYITGRCSAAPLAVTSVDHARNASTSAVHVSSFRILFFNAHSSRRLTPSQAQLAKILSSHSFFFRRVCTQTFFSSHDRDIHCGRARVFFTQHKKEQNKFRPTPFISVRNQAPLHLFIPLCFERCRFGVRANAIWFRLRSHGIPSGLLRASRKSSFHWT